MPITIGCNYLMQMETTLDVKTTLKGSVKTKEQVTLVHFRLKENALVKNGPQLVHFRTANNRTAYMLFLKRRSDGKYEAVNGQMDPILSVKLLARPDGFPPPMK